MAKTQFTQRGRGKLRSSKEEEMRVEEKDNKDDEKNIWERRRRQEEEKENHVESGYLEKKMEIRGRKRKKHEENGKGK